jgi:hypothetical protein
MSKTVAFKIPSKPADPADAWVQSREAAASTPVEPMKRLTIDVPKSLHRRIKTRCAEDGEKMADVLRAMLEERFSASS